MIPLEPGKFYHIYNRGNNSENLFHKEEDYRKFINNYYNYINPIADTYAWVLMRNHFHVIVQIKDHFGKMKNNNKFPDPARQFSHLFNAYAKYFNFKICRTGSLFQRPFKRIWIDSNEYLRNLIIYIHRNPKHHEFTEDYANYPWSSYKIFISRQDTIIKREEVLELFDGIENFIFLHSRELNSEGFDDLLLE